MRLLTALFAIACISLAVTPSAEAQKKGSGYELRDTTSLPPPAPGKAQLVVARDMRIMKDLKPEFVFVDRTPAGILPQLTAINTEVSPGWRRVRLGRGSQTEVWMEFVPDGRYLMRLRETKSGDTWRSDLVLENSDGYAQFALGRSMKLAVMNEAGKKALERNLGKPTRTTAKDDSIAGAKAKARAALPLVIKEAWYLPIPSDAAPTVWQNNPGTLTVDATSLRFARGDSVVVEIPRANITDVYFGSEKGGLENPWIKIGYTENTVDKGVTFADASAMNATDSYNRLFAELLRKIPGGSAVSTPR
jgi:hypothetical protein